MNTHAIFGSKTPIIPWQKQHEQAKKFNEEKGSPLPNMHSIMGLLQRIVVPRSMKWAFMVVGKTGTCSFLSFLHQIEFGRPLTTHLKTDINSSSISHTLISHGIFRRVAEVEHGPAQLDSAERILLTRHPALRAISSFRYMCQADAVGAQAFTPDRLALTAIMGFDWEKHPNTIEGFEIFLNFIKLAVDGDIPVKVDNHWGPQHIFSRPDVFLPTQVCKIEDSAAAYARLSEIFGVKIEEKIEKKNSQGDAPLHLYLNKDTKRLIKDVFSQDFELFDYDIQTL